MAFVLLGADSFTSVSVTHGDTLIVRAENDIITTSGLAVQLNAGASTTELFNYGDLFSSTSTVSVASNNATLQNHGTMTSFDGDAINLVGGAGLIQIYNHGTITTNQGEIIDVDTGGAKTIFAYNSGLMNSGLSKLTNIGSQGQVSGFTFINHGTMQGRELDLNGDGISRLVNTGTISTSVVDMQSGGVSTLVNHGTIADNGGDALIQTSALNDRVINPGTILGRIDLGDGADFHETRGSGLVSGAVQGENGNDTLLGGDNGDLLDGGNNSDALIGRGGDDTLEGGFGLDLLLGGDGDDILNGGASNDTLNGGAGNDTLSGGTEDDVLVGQDGSDELDGGTGNDTLDGGNGDDILEGDAGNDILRGRAGEDELAGGLGRDFLTGGQDADVFVFRALAETPAGANRDQILDFEQGVDLITVAGLSPGVFEFKGTGAFAPSGNPELRLFETPSGATIVQLDANGDGVADAEIRVAGVTGLTADDFAL